MDTSKLSIKVHFEEPVYIDENTVEIYYTLGNRRQSKPIVAKFNGQVWQTVDNE
jgi:Holliday junction resolvase